MNFPHDLELQCENEGEAPGELGFTHVFQAAVQKTSLG